MKEFERLENKRTKRIARLTQESPEGPVEAYLLGIDPPNAAQIEEARAMISQAMAEVEPASREDLDEFIDDLVGTYYLLGLVGKRAAIVKIPHDANGRTTASSFATNDYAAEIRMLEHPEGAYVLHDYRGYTPSEGQPLTRFSAVIQAWNEDDAAKEEGR
jgi:hypothetical protein